LIRKSLLLSVLCILLCVCACERIPEGNLPGIQVDVPLYPKSSIGTIEQGTAPGVPSGKIFNINSVVIQTDAGGQAVLEFYKGNIPGVRVEDFGSYWSVVFVPFEWEADDRIEIWIDKTDESTFTGYEVRQIKKKKKRFFLL